MQVLSQGGAMTISSYVLQYSNVDADHITESGVSLLITEGGSGDFSRSAISAEDLDQIQSAGTAVIGYVNLCVTDDARAYWNPDWTSDGTDTGTPTGAAPDWLLDQPANAWGYIVDFTDPDWQALVTAQAVALIEAGFDGVFLDDMAQYFIAGATALSIPEQASAMMAFVMDIADAIRLVNPDAMLVVNGTPYIVSDGVGGTGSALSQDFLQALDAMLLEHYWGITNTESAAIAYALEVIAPQTQILALDYGGTAFQNTLVSDYAEALSIPAYLAAESSYSGDGALGTASRRADVLVGTGLDDLIHADRGDDTVQAGGGNDTLDGDRGNDTLDGGTGDDLLLGGKGHDLIAGDDGADTLDGDRGNDTLSGGLGQDLLTGGRGRDTFVFRSVTESAAGAHDTISDIELRKDRIDLSAIDANTTVSGDQAFSFIDSQAFSAAGQLRVQLDADGLYLLGDIDGDGEADFELFLQGLSSFDSDLLIL
jgi:uncharacterized protein (TIGR01370 family)